MERNTNLDKRIATKMEEIQAMKKNLNEINKDFHHKSQMYLDFSSIKPDETILNDSFDQRHFLSQSGNIEKNEDNAIFQSDLR